MLAEIDLVAPPLGVLNFVVHAIAKAGAKDLGKTVRISDVFRGVTPFIGVTVLFLIALVIWPELATWLPALSNAR